MKKRRDPTLTQKHTLYVTPQMMELIRSLVARQPADYQVNDFIREAIRAYLDQQQDLIGSRRHFQKQFQERIDELESTLASASERDRRNTLFHSHVLLRLMAQFSAQVLSALTKKPFTAQELLQKAIIEARQEEEVLDAQIQAVRRMSATRVGSLTKE